MKKLISCLLAITAMISVFSSATYAVEPVAAGDGTITIEAIDFSSGECQIMSSDDPPVISTLSFSNKKATCVTKADLSDESGKCKKIIQTMQKYSTSSGWQDTTVKWEKTVTLKSIFTLTNSSTTTSSSGRYRLKSDVSMQISSGTLTTKTYYSSTVTI